MLRIGLLLRRRPLAGRPLLLLRRGSSLLRRARGRGWVPAMVRHLRWRGVVAAVGHRCAGVRGPRSARGRVLLLLGRGLRGHVRGGHGCRAGGHGLREDVLTKRRPLITSGTKFFFEGSACVPRAEAMLCLPLCQTKWIWAAFECHFLIILSKHNFDIFSYDLGKIRPITQR